VDAELAQAVADKLGVELVVEDMEFDGLPAALASGKIDFIAAGFTKNDERAQTMDFSNEYFTAVQVVVVQKGNAIGIATKDDLKGKKIGVQTGTTGDLYVASDVEGATVQRYENIQLACQDLIAGRVDSVIGDNLPIANLMTTISGLEKVDSIVYDSENYAMAVKKGANADILAAINQVLAEKKANGDIDKLVDKYSAGK
jgi:polar amino acid transport system substrate-binding protein